jgi:hypothetical protein
MREIKHRNNAIQRDAIYDIKEKEKIKKVWDFS